MSLLKEYFQIIRTAKQANRKKGKGEYYEAHHIVPESFEEFGKSSSLVLLTAREHYECHRLLAEAFKAHPKYGKKMLWAFHRMAYNKKRKLTADEYAEARQLLMTLWTRKQTEEHKKKISEAQKGNKNNSSRVYKGMKSDMTSEGKQKLAEARKRDQTGKVGLEAKASKGVVICEYEDGRRVEAGSALQLAKITGIPPSTVGTRLLNSEGRMKRGYKVYYK